MNIDAITQVLGTLSPASPTAPATPDLASQLQFEQLLKTPQLSNDVSAVLSLQGQVNSVVLGTDLAAKVAGALTSGVNKLLSAA